MKDIEVVHTYIWLDLGYTVEINKLERSVDFIVMHIVERKNGIPQYFYVEDTERLTSKLEDAIVAMSGSMNWDGCMEIFNDCGMHFCQSQDVDKFSKMMGRLYKTLYKSFK